MMLVKLIELILSSIAIFLLFLNSIVTFNSSITSNSNNLLTVVTISTILFEGWFYSTN